MNAATNAMPVIASTIIGAPSAAFRKVQRVKPFISRTRKPSLCSLPAFGLSNSEHSTGMTVSDTTNEAAMLTMVAMAMGVNRRPSSPSNPSKGRNTSTMMIVA